MRLARMVLVLVSCFAWSVQILQAKQDAALPTNSVKITVEVGKVIEQIGYPVLVIEKATITKKGVEFSTILHQPPIAIGLGNPQLIVTTPDIILDDELAKGLMDALTATLAKPENVYSKKIGILTIANMNENNKRIVTIRTESYETNIGLDVKNAASLVRLLKMAQDTQKWMKDRAAAFQK